MKFRFSTTAMAMCVALGLTACGSSGGGNDHSAAKTEVSNPSAQTQPSTQNQSHQTSSTQTGKQQTQNSDNSWRKEYFVIADPSTAELKWDKKTYRAADAFFLGKKNEIMDFDKLSGGKQGYFEGSFEYEGVKDIEKVHYSFVNQPYSTYGILDSNQWGTTLVTPTGVARDASQPTIMTGTATYKGQVIGSIGSALTNTHSKPALDGTAELKVKFNGDRALVSGELNTNLVGKIILPEIQSLPREENGIMQFSSTSQTVTDVEKFNKASGSYHGVIAGENANDVIGSVAVSDLDTSGDYKTYQAAFGGTKQ